MTTTRKTALVEQMIALLSAELTTQTAAAQATAAAATHEESKAENQYDTRGLEASYLAGAQQGRVAEIEAALLRLKNTPLRLFSADDRVALTALVTLSCDDQTFRYFLMPVGGGLTLHDGSDTVLVVTPQAPLGKALTGKVVGDDCVTSRTFEIIEIS